MREPFGRGRPIFFALLVAALTFCAAREASAQAVGPGDVLFNEFRLEGPQGNSDEYIEFYCNRDAPCDLTDYLLISHDPETGDFSVAFPSGSLIPARGYLLVGDGGSYSLEDYAFLDFSTSGGGCGCDFFLDNQGLQLRTPDEQTVIDSVGFGEGGGTVAFIEGTGLQPATSARPDDQYAYVRKAPLPSGRPQDTNDNAEDFVLVSITGQEHPGAGLPVLGAPGPQNIFSPIERNAAMAGSLVEPGLTNADSPNRVRTGSGDGGTLSLRRSITNNTGFPVFFLRFRVIETTTLNSRPPFCESGGQADLRLVTSQDAETFTNSQGRTVVIRGTVLEHHAGADLEPSQPHGGGLNSSAVVELPDEVLGEGDTIDVQFLLNVVRAGCFRFYVNVEAVVPEEEGGEARAGARRPSAPAAAPRQMGQRRAFPRKVRSYAWKREPLVQSSTPSLEQPSAQKTSDARPTTPAPPALNVPRNPFPLNLPSKGRKNFKIQF